MGRLSMGKLWLIAYRDLCRNKRRSSLTLVAVALGMGLLIVMSGLIKGAVDGSVENAIRLQKSPLHRAVHKKSGMFPILPSLALCQKLRLR